MVRPRKSRLTNSRQIQQQKNLVGTTVFQQKKLIEVNKRLANIVMLHLISLNDIDRIYVNC